MASEETFPVPFQLEENHTDIKQNTEAPASQHILGHVVLPGGSSVIFSHPGSGTPHVLSAVRVFCVYSYSKVTKLYRFVCMLYYYSCRNQKGPWRRHKCLGQNFKQLLKLTGTKSCEALLNCSSEPLKS